MEAKDWILLVVPIFCNGILLACFGKFIDYKIKKMESKEKTKDEVKAEFREKLILIKTEYAKLICAVRDGQFDEFEERVKNLMELCDEAEIFCMSRKPILDSSIKIIRDIYGLYNDWVMHLMNQEQYSLEEMVICHQRIWTDVGKKLDDLMKINI